MSSPASSPAAAKPKAAPTAAGPKRKNARKKAALKGVNAFKTVAPTASKSAAPKGKAAPPKALPQDQVVSRLGDAIVAGKALQHAPDFHIGVGALFGSSLSMGAAGQKALIEYLKGKDVTATRVPDAEFDAVPESVPRPGGPAEYFQYVKKDGSKGYFVATLGEPYVFVVPSK